MFLRSTFVCDNFSEILQNCTPLRDNQFHGVAKNTDHRDNGDAVQCWLSVRPLSRNYVTGNQWTPPPPPSQRATDTELCVFFLLAWKIRWINSRVTLDFRRNDSVTSRCIISCCHLRFWLFCKQEYTLAVSVTLVDFINRHQVYVWDLAFQTLLLT